MAPKLGRVGHTVRSYLPYVTKPFGHVVLQGHIKNSMLYFYYQKVYGHQTLEGGDLLLEASTHKVTQPFEHEIKRGHVINSKHVSSAAMPMTTNMVGWFYTMRSFLP